MSDFDKPPYIGEEWGVLKTTADGRRVIFSHGINQEREARADARRLNSVVVHRVVYADEWQEER